MKPRAAWQGQEGLQLTANGRFMSPTSLRNLLVLTSTCRLVCMHDFPHAQWPNTEISSGLAVIVKRASAKMAQHSVSRGVLLGGRCRPSDALGIVQVSNPNPDHLFHKDPYFRHWCECQQLPIQLKALREGLLGHWKCPSLPSKPWRFSTTEFPLSLKNDADPTGCKLEHGKWLAPICPNTDVP